MRRGRGVARLGRSGDPALSFLKARLCRLSPERMRRKGILAFVLWAAALPSSAQAGEIRGWVRLAGPVPQEEFQPVFKHREFCGERMPSERIRVGADRGVADVLITLEGVSAPGSAAPARTAVLDNRRCRFVPRIQVAPPGTRLEIRNSDPILHTIHAYLGSGPSFTWRYRSFASACGRRWIDPV